MLRPSPAGLDVSETSEDYVTATDNSGATDSSSRRNKVRAVPLARLSIVP
jgi:hypothetical protein